MTAGRKYVATCNCHTRLGGKHIATSVRDFGQSFDRSIHGSLHHFVISVTVTMLSAYGPQRIPPVLQDDLGRSVPEWQTMSATVPFQLSDAWQ